MNKQTKKDLQREYGPDEEHMCNGIMQGYRGVFGEDACIFLLRLGRGPK